MLVVDRKTGVTPIASLREITTAPSPDNVRGLLDRLAHVRDIGLPTTIVDAIHPDRLRQLVREGRDASAQRIGRYTPSRWRATLAAMILDQEAKLAQEGGTDGFAAADTAVGWDKLLRARTEARVIADLAGENPLVRAADQWSRLQVRADAARSDRIQGGSRWRTDDRGGEHVREMNRSGRRDVPPDAPMPFKKEWRTLIREGNDKPDRRLWEIGVMAHLRNKWRSGDVWVERSSNYRRFDSYMLPAAEAAPIADRGRELDWG